MLQLSNHHFYLVEIKGKYTQRDIPPLYERICGENDNNNQSHIYRIAQKHKLPLESTLTVKKPENHT